MSNKKIQEGIESINRIKLLMGYSLDKTFEENIKEQTIPNTNTDLKNVDKNKLSKDEVKKIYDFARNLNNTNQKNTTKTTTKNIPKSWEGKPYLDPNYKIKPLNLPPGALDDVTSELELTGPFKSENNTPFYNDVVIISPENVTKTFFILKNKGNRPVNVLDVKTDVEGGEKNFLFTYLKDETLKKGGELKITMSILDSPIIKEIESQSPSQKNVEKNKFTGTNVKRKTGTELSQELSSQLGIKPTYQIPEEKRLNPKIFVSTNIGFIDKKIKCDYSQTVKTIKSYEIKAKNRRSIYGNKIVPEGYSPFTFDEFLKKFKELIKECPELSNKYNELITLKEQTPIQFSPEFIKGVGCSEKFEKLNDDYYDSHFSKGVTKEDKEYFFKTRKESQQKIIDFIINHPNYFAYNEYKIQNYPEYELKGSGVYSGDLAIIVNRKTTLPMVTIAREVQVYATLAMPENIKKEWEQLLNQVRADEEMYGYDVRTSFDKFMDSNWGMLAQFGASLLLLAIGGAGGAAAGWAMAADVLLNVGIGVYQINRGNTLDGLISFLFLGIGRLHTLYEQLYLELKIYRSGLTREAFKDLCQSVVKKIGGMPITNITQLNAVLAGLEPLERKAVLTLLRTDSKIIEGSLKGLAEEVKQIKGIKGGLPFDLKNAALNLGRKTGGFLGKVAIDMAVVLPLVEFEYNSLKEVLKLKGIDITFIEKDHENYRWIGDNLTESQQKLLLDNLAKVFKLLNKEEAEWYNEKLKDVKYSPQEFIDFVNMPSDNVEHEKKKQEIINKKINEGKKLTTDLGQSENVKEKKDKQKREENLKNQKDRLKKLFINRDSKTKIETLKLNSNNDL